jgi:hypothetical protein
VIVVERQALIDAGGYDERFEFYGPEDEELNERLVRRGLVAQEIPGMLSVIRTPNSQKTANYRVKMSKREMVVEMHKILDENRANHLMVANRGSEWGAWSR